MATRPNVMLGFILIEVMQKCTFEPHYIMAGQYAGNLKLNATHLQYIKFEWELCKCLIIDLLHSSNKLFESDKPQSFSNNVL